MTPEAERERVGQMFGYIRNASDAKLCRAMGNFDIDDIICKDCPAYGHCVLEEGLQLKATRKKKKKLRLKYESVICSVCNTETRIKSPKGGTYKKCIWCGAPFKGDEVVVGECLFCGDNAQLDSEGHCATCSSISQEIARSTVEAKEEYERNFMLSPKLLGIEKYLEEYDIGDIK